MKKTLFVLVIVAALVAALALTGCSGKAAQIATVATTSPDQAKVVELQKQVDELTKERDQLQKELDTPDPLPLDEAIALYDGMRAANKGLEYGEWKYNLSDRLMLALGDINSYPNEGKSAAHQRYVTLRGEVMAAVKKDGGFGWEEDLFKETDSQYGYGK